MKCVEVDGARLAQAGDAELGSLGDGQPLALLPGVSDRGNLTVVEVQVRDTNP